MCWIVFYVTERSLGVQVYSVLQSRAYKGVGFKHLWKLKGSAAVVKVTQLRFRQIFICNNDVSEKPSKFLVVLLLCHFRIFMCIHAVWECYLMIYHLTVGCHLLLPILQEKPLSRSLQRGEDAQFDQVSMYINCGPPG